MNFDPISVTTTIAGSAVWNGTLTDKVHASGIDVDLDAKTVSHNAANGDLEDTKEQTDGAFLPVNNDDDDYTATPGGSNGADHLQPTGAIQGENDLLPIVLRKVKRGGTFRLEIPNHLKVWKGADRTDPVTATTDIDASVETMVYVEGISKDSSDLKVNWTLGGQSINNGDQLKVTAFEWTGPLNVPGYSIYNYKAEGALATSKWITPSDGTIKTGANTSDVTILWGEGAVVGKAVYEVNDRYTWDLEVNVVRVRFSANGNTADYSGGATSFQTGGAGTQLIASGDVNVSQAMTAEIVLEEVVGPTLNGVQRGRKFLEIGHVHQARADRKHGLYDNSAIPFRRRSSLQDGNWHWDAADQGTIPWTFNRPDHFLDITSDTQLVQNHQFSTFDTPRWTFTDNFTIAGDQVDRVRLGMSHRLYIAVRIKDTNYADVLTQRATLNWSWDGDGTVDAAGVYTHTGGGVSGDGSYAIVTNGTQVPSAEPNMNEILQNSQTWHTENR